MERYPPPWNWQRVSTTNWQLQGIFTNVNSFKNCYHYYLLNIKNTLCLFRLCMCAHVHTRTAQHLCWRSEDTMGCASRFSPSTMWVLRNELRSSGLAAVTFTERTISLGKMLLLTVHMQQPQAFFYSGVDSALLFLSTEMWRFGLCQELKFQCGTRRHRAAARGGICLVSVNLSA